MKVSKAPPLVNSLSMIINCFAWGAAASIKEKAKATSLLFRGGTLLLLSRESSFYVLPSLLFETFFSLYYYFLSDFRATKSDTLP
jgi:hypothetical protein